MGRGRGRVRFLALAVIAVGVWGFFGLRSRLRPVVLRGSPLRLGRHREHGRGGAARGGGRLLAGVGEGFPVVLSGVAVAAGNAHCVRSWVPKDRHPVGAAEGCGPQVRELGLRGAGNHVVRPLLAQPGGRRKASPLGSRP